MKYLIIFGISSLCIVLGAIVKLNHCPSVYSTGLMTLGLIGCITAIVLFVINRLRKGK
jgi:Co/Zn/Cd efflux system component